VKNSTQRDAFRGGESSCPCPRAHVTHESSTFISTEAAQSAARETQRTQRRGSPAPQKKEKGRLRRIVITKRHFNAFPSSLSWRAPACNGHSLCRAAAAAKPPFLLSRGCGASPPLCPLRLLCRTLCGLCADESGCLMGNNAMSPVGAYG